MTRTVLPDVVYIGLQKTGSTFLRGYFRAHPNVAFTRHGKFFQAADAISGHADSVGHNYANRFADAPSVDCLIDMYEAIGMGYYLNGIDDWVDSVFLRTGGTLNDGPVITDHHAVAERVRTTCPKARILLTVRNQPSWLYSNYRHFFEGLADGAKSVQGFFSTIEGKLVLDAAAFDRIVDVYDRTFGAENVHVIPLETIEQDEENALKALCHFLGVQFVPYADEQKDFNKGRQLTAMRPNESHRGPLRRLLRSKFGKEADDRSEEKAIQFVSMSYAASNARLARRLDVDLGKLGYPL